ncbi:hypothetical protein [Streptomyces sp. NPDC005907]|uniref:hypothetical protein n=1 Tax=Streptomyces sp. NPDC005907 TaxID=3154571 RepID=UPI0033FF8B07
MSAIQQNTSAAPSNTRLFTITWLIGVTVFLYFLGSEYQLPESAETVRQWAFSTSLVGLAGCLSWFASGAMKSFFTPKTIKALDATGRGVEKLKRLLGGGSNDDTTAGS